MAKHDNDPEQTQDKPHLKLAAVAGQTVEDVQGTSMEELLDPALTVEVDYDTELLEQFLDVVFHAGLVDGEHIATWLVNPKKVGGYAIDDERLAELLSDPGFKAAKKLYFSTATLRRDAQGLLRHKNDNFLSARVLVLDDIGDKVPVSKLPRGMDPTYIIETSEGSFQYGYVYDEPIRSLDVAAGMVQLAYDAGFSDAGGKLAVKQVRLPAGVNGKSGFKGTFKVRLVSMDGPLWSPADLLDKMNLGVTWEELKTDAAAVARRRANINSGASIWSPGTLPSLDGAVDPVLEYLINEGLYEGESSDGWVNIVCPNAHNHSDGNPIAGYIPLGRGEYPDARGFRCFHDHCANITTAGFLQHIASNGGPQASVRDPAGGMTAEWVFDAADNAAWRIKNTRQPMRIPVANLANLYPNKARVINSAGREVSIGHYRLWLTSPSRVSTYGACFSPGDPSRLVTVDGNLMVNLYTPPAWGAGPINEYHIQRFNEFLEYLIPAPEERHYFVQWLSAKVQNAAFRGAAILMIAKRHGTGRTTLGDMVKTLFTEANVTNVPFKQLIGDDQFNEWAEYPIVITDETLQPSDRVYYSAYEKLKEIVDPRPKLTTINPKYGQRRRVTVYSSYLAFSNHSGSLAVPADDRRFYVIKNPTIPAEQKYFDKINAWLNARDLATGAPAWAAHVWRWLSAQTVDMQLLLAPPPMTEAKSVMYNDSATTLERAVRLVLAAWPNPVVAQTWIVDMLEYYNGRLHLEDTPNWRKAVGRILSRELEDYPELPTTKVGPKSIRPRVILPRLQEAIDMRVSGKFMQDASAKDKPVIAKRIRECLTHNMETMDDTRVKLAEMFDQNDL